jgi:hypothetical protein
MASITLTSVRTAVRERGDLPLSAKFSNDFVDREIQASWTALHRLVESVRQGWFDKEGTASTVANQAYVALPADCRIVKGVDVLDSGSQYIELRQIGLTDRNRYSASTDRPTAYRLSERGFELYPTPNAIYTLRVTYGRKVTALGGTAVDVDEEWQDYVVWSTILRVAASEERPMSDYAAMAQRAEEAIRSGGGDRRQQEPEYLPLREYAPDWWP